MVAPIVCATVALHGDTDSFKLLVAMEYDPRNCFRLQDEMTMTGTENHSEKCNRTFVH